MTRPPIPRRARQRLVLKIEFESASGFRASYLSDLPEGGIRIGTSMEVGQRLVLDISFHGLVDPLQIEAVVRWSLPATHPEGPASGLEFVDPSHEAMAWLSDVLESSTQLYILPTPPDRVLLLELQPFLREVYSQEVRNWAELRDEAPVEIVALDDLAAWLEELDRGSATLGIVDLDGLSAPGLDLYQQLRAKERGAELPLIVLGAPAAIEPFQKVADEADDLLFCLRKPLRFGLLMNTVRMAAHDD